MKGKKNIHISKHSKKRCKERLGLSKNNTDKVAEKALKNGIHYYDASGSLKRYIGYLYESHNRIANNIVIYNRNVYIFQNNRLITLIHLPNQYLEISDKIQRRLAASSKENEDG